MQSFPNPSILYPYHNYQNNLHNSLQAQGISTPHDNDVLCGRGVTTNRHAGNVFFRSLVGKNKEVYVGSTKKEKMNISRAIVDTVRRQRNPPGRFLEKEPTTNLWFDIGDKKAFEKTSQSLRDAAAPLRKKLSDELSDPAVMKELFLNEKTKPTDAKTAGGKVTKEKHSCKDKEEKKMEKKTGKKPKKKSKIKVMVPSSEVVEDVLSSSMGKPVSQKGAFSAHPLQTSREPINHSHMTGQHRRVVSTPNPGLNSTSGTMHFSLTGRPPLPPGDSTSKRGREHRRVVSDTFSCSPLATSNEFDFKELKSEQEEPMGEQEEPLLCENIAPADFKSSADFSIEDGETIAQLLDHLPLEHQVKKHRRTSSSPCVSSQMRFESTIKQQHSFDNPSPRLTSPSPIFTFNMEATNSVAPDVNNMITPDVKLHSKPTGESHIRRYTYSGSGQPEVGPTSHQDFNPQQPLSAILQHESTSAGSCAMFSKDRYPAIGNSPIVWGCEQPQVEPSHATTHTNGPYPHDGQSTIMSDLDYLPQLVSSDTLRSATTGGDWSETSSQIDWCDVQEISSDNQFSIDCKSMTSNF